MVRTQRGWGGFLSLGLGLVMLLSRPAVSLAGDSANITYSEFKFGVLDHDVHFLRGKENGVDINPELVFQSPVSDDWASTVAHYLRWLLQPRPTFGGEINIAGVTSQIYFGGTWSWLLFGNVFQPDDGIIYGFFFGPSFNDGRIVTRLSDRKSLGSNILFREAGDLGYAFVPGYQISVFLDHVSNGGLAKQNQSINNAGIRLGIRF
jgi:hypothetical protein